VEYTLSPEPLLASAVDNRMELLELELRLLADASNIDFARNQALPQLDLEGTYRINGQGPEGADALTELTRNRFEDWSIGVSLSVPLGNEAARSRLRQAILTKLQRLSTKSARELAIRQEVLDAIDAIDNGWQRILAARQSTILNTRSLQAEQRQFDAGASTSTNVLDAAARLAESQLAEIRALVDYQIAQVNLAQATGTLLGAAKIAWQPDEPSDPSQTKP
jgi:outer membrane protein